MSFADLGPRNRAFQKRLREENKAAKSNRATVMYLADQVNLAVYHKRPTSEIQALLQELERACARKGNHVDADSAGG